MALTPTVKNHSPVPLFSVSLVSCHTSIHVKCFDENLSETDGIRF